MADVPWSDVAASPDFKALAPAAQEAARQQYFKEVVAPKVPTEKLPDVQRQFDADTGFATTPGGAATGNPSIAAQGRSGLRTGGNFDPAIAIGGAGVVGGALGAASKEILTGAGNVVGAFPYPAARTVGGFLKGAGQVIGAGGRAAPAAVGAVSGAVSETAGQTAEVMGAGPVTAEAARIAGGAIGPETVNAGIWAARKVIAAPALSMWHKVWKSGAQEVLSKLETAPQTLTVREKEYLDALIAEVRGPAGKTNEPLEKVGSIMGAEGKRLMDEADNRLIVAQAQAAGAKPTGVQAELADIGGSLRDTIAKRNKDALVKRDKQYKKTEKDRDALVDAREGQGSYVNSLPEYQAIIDGLKAQLDNTEAMKRSPDVQKSIQKVISELESSEVIPGQKKLVQSGLNLDLQELPGKPKPTSFQAVDDVRRKLGEVFKGKPAEGYEALNDARGKELYTQLTALQKKFAGGDTGPHAKLLEDYHSRSEALGQFRTKLGKKATALDQYQEGTFATDASTLPATYFKTKASVQALRELTGNQAQVNHAALEFANRELAGKDAAGVRKWLSTNSDWLTETGPTRTLIDRYATKLEGVELGVKNAQDFAAKAAKDSSMLTRDKLPAQRAVDLIKSGSEELWGKVIPAIQKSPQAKTQMVQAVRQVVADQATAKATGDLFSRNIRPFLEGSGIATKAEMDSISASLERIAQMKVSEAEKLGIAKRILLQAAGGWTASAAGRGMSAGYNYATGVPQ